MKRYLLFGIAGLALLLHACRNELAEVAEVVSADALQVERIENFQMLYSDSAVVRVRVTGATMLRHLDKQLPRQEFIDGVVVEFFGPGQHVSSRLTSKYAIRYETEGRVIVRDSVVWQTINDEILETEELIWDEKEKKVYTNKFVTIQRPDEIIYGHGFEANEDFTHSKIKAVEGKIKIDDINNDLKD
ncbi:MAG: LPS export ABC transporter periplasmic protein LptC [Phaeodactylibacter sp.]|nr:LPS export ABC transporter periplasmic protein LptC [Phaeodactylibacter sp.]